MAERHPGREALGHLETVLARRPHKDDHALTRVIQALARFREELIELRRRATRSDQDTARLSRLNAIISVVMGIHFPLGDAPWDECEKAKRWLAILVEDVEG